MPTKTLKKYLKNTSLCTGQIVSYVMLHNVEAERLVLQGELHLSYQARSLRAALPDEEQVQTNIQLSATGAKILLKSYCC